MSGRDGMGSLDEFGEFSVLKVHHRCRGCRPGHVHLFAFSLTYNLSYSFFVQCASFKIRVHMTS